jgi:very-short-patch-repair endonuclease
LDISRQPEREIARLTGRQRTMATTTQLIACGLGEDAVRYRIRAGRYTVVFRGVVSVISGGFPPLAREQAALLACGETAFLSHHTAAFMWGLRKPHPYDIDVTVVGRWVRSRKGMRVHHIRALDRRELRREKGLRVSSPARALLEIAATLGTSDLRDAVGDGIAERSFKPRDIEEVVERHPHARGAARLAALIGDPDARAITRSHAERAFWKLIRESGLPRPQPNVPLGPYLPDFTWPDHRLIVEIDSYQFHAGPDAFQNDREKDLFYRAAGFDVLRFTRNQVVHEPAMVLATVAQALARSRSARPAP